MSFSDSDLRDLATILYAESKSFLMKAFSDNHLRDLAAVAALIHVSKLIDYSDPIDPELAKDVATKCYDLADAMLVESKRRRRPDAGTLDPKNIDPRDWPCEELRLSHRSRKMIRRLQIRTIGQLIMFSERDLLEQKDFGMTSLHEIKAELKKLGLFLGGVRNIADQVASKDEAEGSAGTSVATPAE